MIPFILVFIIGSSLFSVGLSLLMGSMTFSVSAMSLLLGGGLAYYLKDDGIKTNITFNTLFDQKKPIQILEVMILSFVASIGIYQFGFLFYKSDGWWKIANPNNYGDLPFHINLIKNIAHGAFFRSSNPIYSADRLRYPFGMDQFNALLESLGFPTHFHLILTGLLCFFTLLFILHRGWGYWGIMMFFMSGGGLYPLNEASWKPGTSVDWKNLFLAVFVTQRGFLIALPVGLYLIQEAFNFPKGFRNSLKWSLLLGSLAFFHLHSFIFLMLLFFGILAWQRKFKELRNILLPSALIGLPFLLNSIVGGTQLENSISLSKGWTWDGHENAIIYLVKNFSLWILVPISVMWVHIQKRPSQKDPSEHPPEHPSKNPSNGISNGISKEPFKDQGPLGTDLLTYWLLILTIVFCFVQVVPWAWDQIKILLWIYCLWNILFYEVHLKNRSNYIKLAAGLFFFFPGVFYLATSLSFKTSPMTLYQESVLEEAAEALKKMDPRGTIALAPNFDHEFIYWGAKVVMGYEGHLVSHGYNIHNTEKQLIALMSGTDGWKNSLRDLNVHYIVWGIREQQYFHLQNPTHFQMFSNIFSVVHQGKNFTVYKVSNSL